MNERRCPRCGALVGADAEWCGQCLSPLRESDRGTQAIGAPSGAEALPDEIEIAGRPGRPAPMGEGGAEPGVRVEGDRVLWTCPTCAAENPFEERVCSTCGTPFVELFEEPAARRLPPPRRVTVLSLAFPGAGHVAAGRVAEGIARAVVFAYSVGTGLTILLSRRGVGLGPFRALLAVFLLAAAALYAITAMDGSRLARGLPQLLSTRMLLYGATGLMVLTLAVLVVSGLRAGSS